MAVIVQGFQEPNKVFESGIKINGQKYTVFKADDQVMMGRKVRSSRL
jgi:hypothetical protein